MAGDDESTGSGKATHYDDYDWKELSDEVKRAAEVLGYDKKVSKHKNSFIFLNDSLAVQFV